ncbi:acyltransferase [Tessaracoccus sp. MC1627]|nr:acyltransferase [Tessaracoccus sp. MC1627]
MGLTGLVERAWRRARIYRASQTFGTASRLGSDIALGPCARRVNISASPESVGLTVGSHVYLDCMLVTVGNGVIDIGSNCWIGGAGSTAIGAVKSVRIGSNVIISNHVHIYDNNNHPVDPGKRLLMTNGAHGGRLWSWMEAEASPIIIEDNVWIGEFAMVLKGVTIGAGSVVAAHSVVTKSVPPYSIVAGNPARVVKQIKRER